MEKEKEITITIREYISLLEDRLCYINTAGLIVSDTYKWDLYCKINSLEAEIF